MNLSLDKETTMRAKNQLLCIHTPTLNFEQCEWVLTW